MKSTDNHPERSLKIILLKYMIIFVIFTLVLLWLFQVVFLKDFYSSIKRDTLNNIVSSIEKIAKETEAEDYATAAVKNNLLRIASSHDAMAVITDESGNIYYYNDGASLTTLSRLLDTELFRDLFEEAKDNMGKGSYISLTSSQLFNLTAEAEGKGGQIERINTPPADADVRRGESLIYTKFIENEEGEDVGIIVIMQITPLNTTVETLRAQLIYVTAIMLIIALFLALAISRKVARPIEDITRAAKTLGKEKYSYRLKAPAIREVRDLNDTLYFVDGELEKTEKIRKELIANISHDLRTPLTMIKGYSEVMRDIPGEISHENIQVIIDEAERLHSLVQDILVLSKIEERGVTLKRERFNLAGEFRDILARYRTMLESKGYRFELQAEEDIEVEADELKISQVAYNLLNNAVTYTGADKKILVSLKRVEGDRVRAEVRDSGEGIPEDKLTDIWERYYKVDAEHKRAQVGSGLGLSIVKSIIEMHGGTVGVETSPQGSAFWFELPLFTDVSQSGYTSDKFMS